MPHNVKKYVKFRMKPNSKPLSFANTYGSTNFTATNFSSSTSDYGGTGRCDYGILNFDASDCKEPPKFTESYTIDAMKKLGITPDELVELTEEEKLRIPGDHKVKEQIIRELEHRRIDSVEQIKETRQELISQMQKQNLFDSMHRSKKLSATADVESEFSKLQRVQKREIERLIATEIIKRETRAKDLTRQKRMEEMLKTQEEMKQKKIMEENRKRLERELKVKERFKTREQEIEEQKQKQLEDENRRRMREIEREKARKEEFNRQNYLKEAKMKKFREDREIQEQLEQKKREEKDILMKLRDEKRRKQRQEELERLKEQHRILAEKQFEKMTMAQQREKMELEKKIAKMQEIEDIVQKRLELQKKQKAQELAEIRKKNEERFRRSLELSKKIEAEEMKRKEALQIKNEQAIERYIQMNKERERKVRLAQLDNEEKTLQRFEKKRKADEIQHQKVLEIEKRMTEKEMKFEKVKKRQEQELLNKSAIQWLKNKIGSENAQRLQRKIEYENELAVQNLDRKMKTVEKIQQDRQNGIKLVSLKAAQLEKRKLLMLEEVEKMKGKGDELDIELLAEKFDIDIEEVKKKFFITKNSNRLSNIARPITAPQ